MRRPGPTPIQLALVRVLLRPGVQASYREIAAALGVTGIRGVSQHVDRLVRKGLVTRAATKAGRALTVTPLGRAYARGGPVAAWTWEETHAPDGRRLPTTISRGVIRGAA